MIARIATRALIFIGLLITSNAYCFIGQPTFTPNNPSAGDEVFVTIQYGACDAFVSSTPLSLTRTVNTVEVLYSTVSANFCNIIPAAVTSSLGTFSSGTYAVVIKRSNVNLGQAPVISTFGIFTLTVQQGISAATVPSQSLGSLLVLGFGLILILAIAKRRGIAVLAVTCMLGSLAGTWGEAGVAGEVELPELRSVEILLSVEYGAPTSQEVLDYVANPSSGDPPLDAF